MQEKFPNYINTIASQTFPSIWRFSPKLLRLARWQPAAQHETKWALYLCCRISFSCRWRSDTTPWAPISRWCCSGRPWQAAVRNGWTSCSTPLPGGQKLTATFWNWSLYEGAQLCVEVWGKASKRCKPLTFHMRALRTAVWPFKANDLTPSYGLLSRKTRNMQLCAQSYPKAFGVAYERNRTLLRKRTHTESIMHLLKTSNMEYGWIEKAVNHMHHKQTFKFPFELEQIFLFSFSTRHCFFGKCTKFHIFCLICRKIQFDSAPRTSDFRQESAQLKIQSSLKFEATDKHRSWTGGQSLADDEKLFFPANACFVCAAYKYDCFSLPMNRTKLFLAPDNSWSQEIMDHTGRFSDHGRNDDRSNAMTT